MPRRLPKRRKAIPGVAAAGHIKLRAVILDFGGVLSQEPSTDEIDYLASFFQLSAPAFRKLYHATRGPYDRGDLTTIEFWSGIARNAGVDITLEIIDHLCHADREMWSHVNPGMTDWLAKLRPAGYRTALLSNMQWDMIAHVRSRFPWLLGFDHQILSAEVHLIKPDAAIYQLCLERLGVQPADAIFIDDREANVDGARSIGINAWLFRSVGELHRDLDSLGFRPLP